MAAHTYSILFYLKDKRLDKNGKASIYVRITVDGRRAALSLKRKVAPEHWDSRMNKMKGKDDEAKELNYYMTTIRHKLNKIHHHLVEEEKPFSAQDIKSRFLGGHEPYKMLLDVFEEHNKHMKSLIGREFALGTWKRYNTTYKHVAAFVKKQYGKNDFPIRDIDHKFITRLEYFLMFTKECNHNSALKYVNNFKKIIRMAVANDWIQKDPFYNYKVKFKEVEREYLTKQELESIVNLEIRMPRLDIVRDMFVFCCFTGLAYIDVKKLTPNNIVPHIDGSQWIQSARQKTRSKLGIPLLPSAMEILEKYEDHPKVQNGECVIPVLSNQKSNAYLKEIADRCGITKNLTTHLARHTFATTVTLSNGMPIETVGKLLGHKNLRTTQHYAKIVNKKVSEDMAILKEKLSHVALVRKSSR